MPRDVRRLLGFELWAVQLGDTPSDFKSMPSVGPGVQEIRVNHQGAYRLLYLAKFDEAVYVLHVFEKKARKTSDAALRSARQRLGEVMQRRRKEHLE